MAEKIQKKKKSFKIPHLLYIMLGLLFIMSLLTYVIPAGQFGKDSAGNVSADMFKYLPEQTPISPLNLIFMILDGLVKVNGEVETRRGKKLYKGDKISFAGNEFVIGEKWNSNI